MSSSPPPSDDAQHAAGIAPLLDAHKAFEAGDFRTAGREAKRLVVESPVEATREAARALLDRLNPDPVILWLTVGCVLLFVLVVASTSGH